MASEMETDVAIIGAGPVGLFAVFELGMLKLSSVLIDALSEVGGQCAALYPEKPIYDIPAHASIHAGALISQLERQIAPFHAPRLLGRRVIGLTGQAGAFVLATDQGDTVRARAVLIAAGAGAFGPNRPPLEGLAAYRDLGRGAVLRAPQRGPARKARGDRRRRRLGGGLGTGVARDRAGRRGAPAAQVPRRSGERGTARRRGAKRRDRHGGALPVARAAWGRRCAAACGGSDAAGRDAIAAGRCAAAIFRLVDGPGADRSLGAGERVASRQDRSIDVPDLHARRFRDRGRRRLSRQAETDSAGV